MKPLTRYLGIALAVATLCGSLPVQADPHGRRWYREDIRHFERHDLPVWRGGYWHNGRHAGRWGWWWVVGGVWYFYPRPAYPYPDPYVPPVVVAPPAVTVPPVAEAAPTYWYYCEPSRAYYPYVATCPKEWRRVPATPPGVAEQ
jgi:hypothetical protein